MTLLDADLKMDPDLGEDTCELFGVIESSFGVELGDYQALLGLNVSELAALIHERANYPSRERCLSAVSFYRLRRSLETCFKIPRNLIRPTTPVADLLPWRTRRRQWASLQSDLSLYLPTLTLPRPVFLFALFGPTALIIVIRLFSPVQPSALLIVVGGIFLALPAIYACMPFARSLPVEGETVGGLAKIMLACNYSAFATPHGSSLKDEGLAALRQLLALQVDLPLEKVTPRTIIPGDLNIS